MRHRKSKRFSPKPLGCFQMPQQDTTPIKEKIISTIKLKGPSLPVHISKEIQQNILFTSAFLSELLSEQKLKMSNMRVGNSPIYFLQGQEPQLEKFSQHLNHKEKETFNLLKETQILQDKEQQPATRVALRSIKDFAIPFKKNEELHWRYLTIPEPQIEEQKVEKPFIKKIEESKIENSKPQKKQEEKIQKPETSLEKIKEIEKPIQPISPILEKTSLNIFDQKQKLPEPKKTPKRKIRKPEKKNEKFFNRVKEFLTKNSTEIIDIESFNKNDLILRIKTNEKEQLLIAYNKKRINENDLIKAGKKALEANLQYTILNLGEPPKKLEILIQSIKKLNKIQKLDNQNP